MGQEDLTKQYSSLFEKTWRKNPFSFIYDVYRSGKTREIISFFVWELFHKVGLFPKSKYITFTSQPLKLGDEKLNTPDFDQKLEHFFTSRQLRVTRSEHNWKLLFQRNDGVIFGCLYPDDRKLFKSLDHGKTIVFVNDFSERIKSIFISSKNTLFVCVKGAVYKSADEGVSYRMILDLGSAESFFRHNNAMSEMPDGTLVIGEYGNIWDPSGWRNLANLYFSFDDGETWQHSEFLKRMGTNKHVHIVGYSRLLNRMLVADGDNYKRLWISNSLDGINYENPNWRAVNKLHIQMGGYTSFVESNGKVLFGTDYQGGTNFLVESADGKKFTSRIVPDPYRRSPIDNMVLRRSKTGNEIWANLPYSTAGTKCLLMYSTDGGRNWTRIFEYSAATSKVWLIGSSSEVADELYFSVEDLKGHNRSVYKVLDG
jgi:hypothetical protein